MYVCNYIYMCVYLCMYVCVYLCMYMCVYNTLIFLFSLRMDFKVVRMYLGTAYVLLPRLMPLRIFFAWVHCGFGLRRSL